METHEGDAKDNVRTKSDKFEIIRKILNDKIATDVTIIASNDAQIKCHKSFLIAHSSMFEAMLNSGMQEARTNVISMKTVSEPVVRALLAYLYCWDLKDASNNSEIAVELLKAADYYNIPRLDKDMSNLLLSKPAEWFSVDGALDLFLLSNGLNRAPLKLTAVRALQMKLDELKTNPSYLELFKKDPTTAMELCNAALSMKPAETSGASNGNADEAGPSSSMRNSFGWAPGNRNASKRIRENAIFANMELTSRERDVRRGNRGNLEGVNALPPPPIATFLIPNRVRSARRRN